MIISEHAAGSVLFHQGEKVTGVYVLYSGKLKITARVSDDRTALLEIAKPGEILGLTAFLASHTHSGTAFAVVPSNTGFISGIEMAQLMRRYSTFTEAIARFVASKCMQMTSDVVLLRVPSSSAQRLAAALLRISAEENIPSHSGVSLGLTHAELGQIIGTSRETVSRLMQKFQRDGLIRIGNSEITITDRHLLSEMAPGPLAPEKRKHGLRPVETCVYAMFVPLGSICVRM